MWSGSSGEGDIQERREKSSNSKYNDFMYVYNPAIIMKLQLFVPWVIINVYV